MSDEQQNYDRGQNSTTVVIVIFLVILLIVAVAIWAIVTATRSDADRLVYAEKSDGTLEVAEIKNTYKDGWFCKKSLTVPEEVDGKKVTSIARLDSAKLQTIVLPVSATEIKARAFSGCTSLSEITWSDKITSIGDGALENCSSLKSIRLPEGVTEIKAKTFSGCTSLSEIVWSDKTTAIGASGFEGCVSLEHVEFSENLISLGDNSFAGAALTALSLPSSVTEIGVGAFLGCNRLNKIEVAQANDTYHSAGNCLIETATMQLILGCSSSEIPEGVTSIGASAFDGCAKLVHILIPEGVTSIGASAFDGCAKLVHILIPESVTTIGSSAFRGCDGLTSVIIPASVAEIGAQAFDGCTNLREVYFRQADGWTAGTAEPFTGLDEPETAAERLKNEYRDKKWTRSEA